MLKKEGGLRPLCQLQMRSTQTLQSHDWTLVAETEDRLSLPLWNLPSEMGSQLFWLTSCELHLLALKVTELLVVTWLRYSRLNSVSLSRLLAFWDQLCRRTPVEIQNYQFFSFTYLKFTRLCFYGRKIQLSSASGLFLLNMLILLLGLSLVNIDFHCTDRDFEAQAY